ncbi:MAG: hypothetical protein DME67_00945 [Verrucomicrobia bacterium]|nr:MAG: hypothetical protein DME95_07050 [Verrucomicrobiota bacterium]PYK07325.1 MAG: hypothetical protein DME67_00945 [Verrucomicrobiota bacterium]
MNTNEAKEKLLLYRERIDDADPRFQEALAQVRRDPELAEWLREQMNCYDAIRSKLREVEPRSDLAEKIVRNQPIPFRRDWTQMLKLAAAIILSAGITAVAMTLWQRDGHRLMQGREIVVKGEVLDLTCYVAYNWSGPKHASCAMDCIKSGLPVGIKTEDGKVYLLTGKEAHVNDELADYAAKIVTVRGKKTARDGFAQIQVEEIRKF